MTTISTPRGRFIVLEGIDGSGKTTQLEALADWLPTSGLMPPGARLVTTWEPGGTPLGWALRDLLLHPPEGLAPCPAAELLLYVADRAQHVATVIRPALAAGDWVISDRFSGSTVAYQGCGRGWTVGLLAELEQIATIYLVPDIVLWLDLPVEESRHRRGLRPPDRIERQGVAFLDRVALGFANLAIERDWTRIDASQPPEQVTADCQAHLLQHFS